MLSTPSCGGGNSSGDVTLPRVDAIAPQLAASTPTPFTITGLRFDSALGSMVVVSFDVEGGATPFLGGFSSHAEVPGTVASDSTITGVSPPAVLSGVGQIPARVTVRFPGGFEASSSTQIAVFQGPTVTGLTPATIPSEIPTSTQVTGTNFGPNGIAASVTFQAASGTPFAGGTSATLVAAGTVTSDSTIDLTTPLAGLTGSMTALVSVDIAGATGVSASPLATFEGPTVTGMTAGTVPGAIPTAITIDGTGFGPDATAVVVRFTAAVGTPFSNGSSATVDVPGVVASPTSITCTSPSTQVCGLPLPTAVVSVLFPTGASATTPAPVATFSAPTFGGFLPLSVNARAATAFTISGTGFGPALGSATVTFTATSGTPFAGSASATVPGTVDAAISISGTAPTTLTATSDFSCTVLVTLPNGSCAASAPGAVLFKTNALPVVTTSLSGDELRLEDYYGYAGGVKFDVTATDPNGDPVTLSLLNPPNGCRVTPIVGGTSPATLRFEWKQPYVRDRLPLYFAAHDSVEPTRLVTRVVWVQSVEDDHGYDRWRVDVTGDGTRDLITAEPYTTVGGVQYSGAIYVWDATMVSGGAASSVLTVPSPAYDDELGSFVGFGDVSGDGTTDIVGVAQARNNYTGELYVWAGGASLGATPAPLATLVISGYGHHTSLSSPQLVDVSGDGILDVVICASYADSQPVYDAGAVLVWFGGATLTGTRSPDAVLLVSSALDYERPSLVEIADFSGDGVADVLTRSSGGGGGRADLFRGGGALTGVRFEDASFRLPAAITATTGATVSAVDLDGDGFLDVVLTNNAATVGGVVAVGVILVWKGGPAVVGAPAPDAILSVAGAGTQDRLCWQHALFADVTGDGLLDVVSAAPYADVGAVSDAGTVYVWSGVHGWAGSLDADARLVSSSPGAVDRLGVSVLTLADLTGDGVLDVVVGSPYASPGGVTQAGKIQVWTGGGALAGTVASTAVCAHTGASPFDNLGEQALFADVTGDDVLDLIVPVAYASVSGTAHAGAVFVWTGGAALSGAQDPSARIVRPTRFADDYLGDVRISDFTGDGVPDLLVGASQGDTSTVVDRGYIGLWKGGAGLTGVPAPWAELEPTAESAVTGFTVGRVADLTGDGLPDILNRSSVMSLGTAQAGQAWLWKGGATLTGATAQSATSRLAAPASGDGYGTIFMLTDFDGDGTLDALFSAPGADPGGAMNAGAIYLQRGGATFSGAVAPVGPFTAPGSQSLGN